MLTLFDEIDFDQSMADLQKQLDGREGDEDNAKAMGDYVEKECGRRF